ncbi:hypothetical protein IRB23SM22_11710 [Alkalibacterium sp. s-m-22]
MGIFDMFKRSTNKEYSNNENIKYIQKTYYSKYPEFPYIAEDRNFKQWKEGAIVPPVVVDKKMMSRNKEGLLNGHVFMVYWIDKYPEGRRIPAYFEYKYGLNFQKEKATLENQGYIDQGNATAKGIALMEKYQQVIDNHLQANKGIVEIDMDKELKRYKKEVAELKSLGIKPVETIEQRKGFLLQTKGINHYKNKEFDEAESFLLQGLEHNFYSPGGVEYLAKIYRKRKDYKNEVDILDKGIKRLISDLPKEAKQSNEVLFEKLQVRRNKARELLEKTLDK